MATWLAGRPAREAVDLDDTRALDPALVGTKAANLARARRAGLPSLEGFVVTTDVTAALHANGLPPAVLAAYDELSGDGRRPVVVRSSAPAEDTGTSSLAGQFTSLVEVVGQQAFVEAVAAVVASAGGEPMAVLVQPHIDPAVSGVAFGLDPVSGRADRQVIAAVRGGPQALVSGAATGDRYELGRYGRLVSVEPGDGDTHLRRRERRAVARLAAAASRAFGGPQDIEWARTIDGRTVLLQARPVTASAARPVGPRYSPGPLAETFPAPLSRLEQDLWLPPLRDAVVEVATLTGRASRRRIRRSDVVISPGGRSAVDVDLVGTPRRRRGVAVFDPRPGARRLAAAWRVGRLQAALAGLAADALAAADDALASVPELAFLDDDELLTVLDRTAPALASLHGHEILAGALLAAESGATGAELALASLRRARQDELADGGAIVRYPEVLALSAPRIGRRAPLPADPPALRPVTLADLGPREALRLRVRWIHELTVLSSLELGRRLATRGILTTATVVRDLSRAQLEAAVRGDAVTIEPAPSGPPLPDPFRLTETGEVVAETAGHRTGTGAGGGRGAGPVHLGPHPPPGAVLVVDVLDPTLATHLPRLAGLVAESGSPLSHLAILAREHGVATVVGVAGARSRWAPGEVLVVDGTTGSIEVLGIRERQP